MTELEPRASITYGSGSKSFASIDGWSLKDKPNPDNPEDIRTIRGQLVRSGWVEASPGHDLFPAVVVMAYLHFIRLINSNPDYLWHYIYYRKAQDARTHNIPTS